MRLRLLVSLLALSSLASAANPYWVSPTGAASWASCQSATALAGTSACSVATANSNAVAGNLIYFRGGTYSSLSITPTNSGTSASSRITFESYPTDGTQAAVFSGGNPDVELSGNSYIVINGFSFINTTTIIMRVENGANHNEILNNSFSNTDGGNSLAASLLYMTGVTSPTEPSPVWVTHNWIHNNTFSVTGQALGTGGLGCTDGGGDDVWIGSDYTIGAEQDNYNTFENNVISHAPHAGLSTYGTYLVVRNNVIHNEPWSSGCADEDGASYNVYTYSSSNPNYSGYNGMFAHRNLQYSTDDTTRTGTFVLTEGNRFGYAGVNQANDGADGLTIASPQNIVRYNFIYASMNPGILFKYQFSSGAGNGGHGGTFNRVYNNTIYQAGYGYPWALTYNMGNCDLSYCPWPETAISIYQGCGTSTPGGCDSGQGNWLKNNIFYLSAGYTTFGYDVADKGSPSNGWDELNAIHNWCTGSQTSTDGNGNTGCSTSGNPLFNNPSLATVSSTTLPDFTLQSGSSALNGGAALTTTTNSGVSSTSLNVADCLYFQDGSWGSSLATLSAGLGGTLQADVIAVGTITNTAQISSIAYGTYSSPGCTITLASPISWSSSASVWLVKKSDGASVIQSTAPNYGAGMEASFTVTVAITGSGSVSGSPGGISCPPTCTATYTSGTNVTLTATAGGGYQFNYFGGGPCGGSGTTCTIDVTAATSVNANFIQTINAAPLTYPFAVTNWCELGTETNCPTATQTPYLGCNYWANGTYTPGAPLWTAGSYALDATVSDVSGNVYLSLENSNTTMPPGVHWQNLGPCGSVPSIGGLTGAGNIITQPFYGAKVVRVTDYNTQSGLCSAALNNPTYHSGGVASDASKFIVVPLSGEICLFAFNPTTLQSAATHIQGFTSGASCLTNCLLPADSAVYIPSRTNPNLIWEEIGNPVSINKLTIAACSVTPGTSGCTVNGSTAGQVAPTFTNAANWVFNRAVIINPFAPPGCSGCNPFPADFVNGYVGNGGVDIYDSSASIVMSDNGQGTPTFGTGPTLTGCSEVSSTVTCTNNTMTGWSPNPSSASPYIKIAGVTPSGYNGTWTLTGTATTTSFSYTDTNTGLGAGTGGTASYPSATCPLPSGADPTNFNGKYGPEWIFNVSLGLGPGGVAGWSLYNTCNGTMTSNYATQVAIYPATASPTSGACSAGTAPPCDPNDTSQQPVGVSGGTALTDRDFLHEGAGLPNPLYANISVATGQAATNPGSCSGVPCSDSETTWEVGTTNVRIIPEPEGEGHSETTFDYWVVGHLTTSFLYHNTTEPGTNIFPVALTEIDQHSISSQQGSQNHQPVIYYPQLVCDITGTPGSPPTGTIGASNGPCPAYYNVGAWQNEAVALENAVGNGAGALWPNPPAYGQHCIYTISGTPTTSSCAYRLFQTYTTGTSYDFNVQTATMSASPNGVFVLATMDWNLTLGCTDGETGPCIDPVSANNSTTAGTPSHVSGDGGAGTTVTVTVSNAMSHGMKVALSGFTGATFLNTLGHLYVYSATSSSLVLCVMPNNGQGNCTTGGVGNASYNASESSGTISWPGCENADLFGAACQRSDVFMVQLPTFGFSAPELQILIAP